MDENKHENMGEMGNLEAVGKSHDGELFFADTSPQKPEVNHNAITSGFNTNAPTPTDHDPPKHLGPAEHTDPIQAQDTPPIMATAVAQPRIVMAPQRPPGRVAPITLFSLTCLTTLFAGTPFAVSKAIGFFFTQGRLPNGVTSATITEGLFMGFLYAGPLMLILLCHEMGHYIQARRNRIPASLPYFIPVPFGFLGTMGAVIGMRANLGDRRSLFDIGISGPLAGLVPTLIFLFVGLHLSEVGPIQRGHEIFGEPLLMQWVIHYKFGAIAAGHDVLLHPMAFAAWVGLLITSLNLIPIGQLDGGHVLHALMPRAASRVGFALLCGAIAASFYFEYPVWALMLFLLLMMGPKHPPTADDRTPIGTFRVILGWLTLAFIFIGFTPMPIKL